MSEEGGSLARICDDPLGKVVGWDGLTISNQFLFKVRATRTQDREVWSSRKSRGAEREGGETRENGSPDDMRISLNTGNMVLRNSPY